MMAGAAGSVDSGSQIPLPEQPPVPELAPQPLRPLLMSTHSETAFGSITSLNVAKKQFEGAPEPVLVEDTPEP